MTDTPAALNDKVPLNETERRIEIGHFLATFLFAIVALIGVLVVLYAWHLPPFQGHTVGTENAMVRGQVTIISPQLNGYVASVNVQDFQMVKKGDLLVQIDDRIYRQKLDQAKANLAIQEASLAEYEQAHLRAEATIKKNEAALANAEAQLIKTENDFRRVSALVKTGAESKRNFDIAQANKAQSNAQLSEMVATLEISRQDLKTVETNLESLKASVSGAKAAVELAQIDFDNTRIIAPEDGALGQVGVRLGAYVTSGTQLMGLVPERKWIIANMKETQMANIRVGQTATFTVDALNKAVLKGHVERISPAAGSEFSVMPADNATGNFVKISQRIPVRISIDPDQELALRMKPGMSVVVTIDIANQRTNENLTQTVKNKP